MLNHWYTNCVPWRRPAKLDTRWFFHWTNADVNCTLKILIYWDFESSGIRITGADGHLDRRSLWPYWGGVSNYLNYFSGFVHATTASTSLLPISGTCEEYQWLEFFAGNAACTTFARLKGFRGCKFDLKYHVENQMRTRKTNYMDVNSDSGFMPFGSKPVYCKRAHWQKKSWHVILVRQFEFTIAVRCGMLPSLYSHGYGITSHDCHKGC